MKRRNRAKCAKCGDIIESKSVHDFVTCGFTAISVDGGREYYGRCGNVSDTIELDDDGNVFVEVPEPVAKEIVMELDDDIVTMENSEIMRMEIRIQQIEAELGSTARWLEKRDPASQQVAECIWEVLGEN